MGAVSMFWLQPRLRAFALGETACPINLTTTDHPRDLTAPSHDLTVLYGDGQFPGRRAQLLFSETLAPMAAPGAETKNLPLLGYPLRGPDWIGWDKWHSQTGHGALADHPRLPCASYAQSVGRALQGDGIVLGSLPLLADEVQRGSLVALPAPRLTTGKGYYLTMPQGRIASDNAARLWAFLTS
jgi:LysR family glycine cleavage system transcriptional activator